MGLTGLLILVTRNNCKISKCLDEVAGLIDDKKYSLAYIEIGKIITYANAIVDLEHLIKDSVCERAIL